MFVKTTGVVLLAFGGADSLDAVEPFMINLMGGRKPSPELVERTKARYELIGGSSPLPKITKQQAVEVERLLNKHGKFKVVAGMRHWHPFIQEAILQLDGQGITDIIAVTLSPHYSRVSTGAYQAEIDRIAKQLDGRINITFAEGWYDHPLYIKALKERINDTLQEIPELAKEKLTIIFSAHSLPVSHIAEGDSYMEQLGKTVLALENALLGFKTKLAYQSKGGGVGEWLGPQVEDVLDMLEEGSTVLVVPIGFACDHIETLYDIDIAQRKHAEDKNINFYRALALNTAPAFMECLTDVVLKKID